MALKHTYTLTIRNDGGGSSLADTKVYTADAEENFADTVAAGGDKEIDLVVDVSNIVSFFIESDKAVTLKTNSTVSPDQTIALAAGVALFWNTDQFEGNPLTVDITKLYFHNAGLVVANVKGGFLVDQGI